MLVGLSILIYAGIPSRLLGSDAGIFEEHLEPDRREGHDEVIIVRVDRRSLLPGLLDDAFGFRFRTLRRSVIVHCETFGAMSARNIAVDRGP